MAYNEDVSKAARGIKPIVALSEAQAVAKAGRVFGVSALLTLASEASNESIFETGSKYAVVIARRQTFDTAGISLDVYRDATYTGGTPLESYNPNDVDSSVTATAVAYSGATITDDGTKSKWTEYLVANSNVVGGGGSDPVDSMYMIFPPNTVNRLVITNLDTSSQTVGAHLIWFETDEIHDDYTGGD